MNIRRILALAATAFLLAAAPARANYIVMCAPDVAGGVQGPRTVGGTTSQVPTGTVYVFGGGGCAPILATDVGFFLSQGYTQGGGLFSMQLTVPVTATGTTSLLVGTLPPSTYIRDVLFSNTDASHAVTGGINVGTTSSGTDVVAAANLAVTTSSVGFVTDANLAKRIFSTTAGQAIYATAATSWNTPTTVTLTITYGYF